MAEEYDKAVATLEKVIEKAKVEAGGSIVVAQSLLYVVQALVEHGQIEQAKDKAAEVLKLNPNFSLQNWEKSLVYKDPAHTERHLSALRKAGLK